MTRAALVLISFAGWVAFASSAAGAQITWAFTGVVRTVDVNLDDGTLAPLLTSLGVTAGSPVAGFMRFETATADLRPEPDNALFADAVQEFVLSLTGASLGLAPDLDPDNPVNPLHAIYMGTFPEIPGSEMLPEVDFADPTGQLNYLFAALELSSHDPSFFDPTALPLDPPSLAALDPFGDTSSLFGYGTDLALAGGNNLTNTNFFSRVELTSLVRVPEPGAWALVALALLSVRYPRRR